MRAGDAIRAVGLIGPTGAGKTTLRAALAAAGAGTAPQEAQVELGFSDLSYLDERFAVVDAPGALDFAAEMDAALPALDLVLVVIDSDPAKVALVQPYLRDVKARGVPFAIFVNKIDSARGAAADLIAALQPMISTPLVARQIPIWRDEKAWGFVDLALERAYLYRAGQPSQRIDMPPDLIEAEHDARFHMLEQLADYDDALLEQLLSEAQPPQDAVFADLVADMQAGLIAPVFFGAALHGFGVRRLLKALRHETPLPAQTASRLGLSGPAAYVMKVSYAGQAGKLAFARMFNGSLSDGADLTLAEGAVRRASGLQTLNGAGLKKTALAREGEIIALSKLEDLRAGDVAAIGAPAKLAMAPAGRAPLYVVAVKASDRKDDVRLGAALAKLMEEDPGLSLAQDGESHETHVRGLGEAHVRTRLDALKRRFNLDLQIARPTTPYKESIRGKLAQRGRHKKQTGGHGQFGDVMIELRPLSRGEGFVFEDRITGGVVPKQWIPAVEQGVRDALEKGPLGFAVVDVAVTLVDGSYHSVDSSEQAFRAAGRLAMSEALRAAEPYLLEPVDRLTIYAPSVATARINGAVTARNGQILGFNPREDWTDWDRIDVYLPHAETSDFLHELKGFTQGMGVFEGAFDHLVEISGKRAEEVMKARSA